MSALIEDVLDFTRCQLGGDVSIRLRRVVDIFGALEPVVQEELLANPQANIVFHHTGAAALLCDPGRIKQLMSDLIANAVAHGLKGGPILIKGQVNQSTLQLTCTNVGQPILEALLGSLFEPFTRTKRDSPSEGLGLYICSQIAKEPVYRLCDLGPTVAHRSGSAAFVLPGVRRADFADRPHRGHGRSEIRRRARQYRTGDLGRIPVQRRRQRCSVFAHPGDDCQW